MRIVFFTLFVIFFGYDFYHLEAQNKKKHDVVAVLDFQGGKNIEQADALALTVHFRKRLEDRYNIHVISREDMYECLTINNLVPAEPYENGFIMQAGRTLNADFIVAGQISGAANKYTVEIRMLHILSGNVVDSYKRDYSGDISGLTEIINSIAGRLVQKTRIKKYKHTEEVAEIVPHFWFAGAEGGFPFAAKRKWDGRFSLMATWERNLSKNFILGIRAGYIDYKRKKFSTDKPKFIQYPILIQFTFIFPNKHFVFYPGVRFMGGISLDEFINTRFYENRKIESKFSFGLLFRKDLHKHCYLQLSGDMLFSSSESWGPYGDITTAVYAGIGYRIGK